MSINLTDINTQDVVRNDDFSINKTFTISAPITQITAFENLGCSTNDVIDIKLLKDDVEVTSFPVSTESGTFKLKLTGVYNHAYDQDIIYFVPPGKSSRFKNAVYDDEGNELEPERLLTDAEFEIEKQKFPDIVQPTIITNGIGNVPDGNELIRAEEDMRDEVDVTHTVKFTTGASSSQTISFTHTVIRTNTAFQNAIRRVTGQRGTATTNTRALAFGQSKLLGSINTGTQNTIFTTEDFVTAPNAAQFTDHWNSVVAGNVCKWRPIEGDVRGQFNFTGADKVHAFAKRNGLKFLWHTLLWGANQGHPSWFIGLDENDSKVALNAWFKAIADRYGDDIYGLQVVNEINPGHQSLTTTIANQLGGAGKTGFDWAIYVYERARHYFPNALLWTNDFGMLSSQTKRDYMINFANILKSRGLVDAFGCQAHYFNIDNLTKSEVVTALDDISSRTGLPIHITELDISGNTQDGLSYYTDALQLERYQRIFPSIWNHPAVERVNLWGYITGETWRYASKGRDTGLVNRDGTGVKPAFTWLQNFILTGNE